ncbi:MAG: hypothetical protein IJ157_15095 [Clostridia bacterium]|nr:hypothetical protein [Clostridia bacterium]
MEDVLMEMVKDRVDERVAAKEKETKSIAIRDVMDAFGVSVDKAMESLKIPVDQRSSYSSLVMQLKPQAGAVAAQI